MLLRFPGDAHPVLWLECHVLALLGQTKYIVMTPDGDVEKVDLKADSIGEVKPIEPQRAPSLGASADDAYLIFFSQWPAARGFFTRGELLEFEQKAEEMLEEDKGEIASDGRSSSDRPNRRHVKRGPPRRREDFGDIWWAAEGLSSSSFKIELGGEVDHPSISKIIGDDGFCDVGQGERSIFIRTTFSEEEFVKSLGPSSLGLDARTLPMFSQGDKLVRSWCEAVEACYEEGFDASPCPRPCSASWCQELFKKRFAPPDRPMTFKGSAKLRVDQCEIGAREQLVKYLEFAGKNHQLDWSDCAVLLAILRRAQKIKRVYHDSLRVADLSARDKISPKECFAFSGRLHSGEVLTGAPALLDQLKTVVERDAAIMKDFRKAREKRAARKKK